MQRLSVGVQSFDDGLLKQMDRYDKYGSGAEILERIGEASPYFTSLNVDMIFNFPAQTEDILINDIERVVESGTQPDHVLPAHGLTQRGAPARPHRGHAWTTPASARTTRSSASCLAGGPDPLFEHGSAWTFNKRGTGAAGEDAMIDEYVVDYEEYPAIGSGRHHVPGRQPVREHVLRERLQRSHRGRAACRSWGRPRSACAIACATAS